MKEVFVLLLCLELCGCAIITPVVRQERRQAFVNINPKISKHIKQAILKGQLLTGMTIEQVTAALGENDLLFSDEWITPNNHFYVAESSIEKDGRFWIAKLYFLDGKLYFYELR